MSTNAGSSYDDLPYEGSALYLTHPDHLAALARLFGVHAPQVETCRIFELGCAQGGNLIPMAWSLPRARLVGIDLSGRQIDAGRAVIAQLGLKNIEMRKLSIEDAGPELGQFDFVLAHGIFSWVPAPVQEAMLRLCAQILAPNGLAYISYNTYPGWHMRTMLRDMMLFRARAIDNRRARVSAGRAFIRDLAEVLTNREHPYAKCLTEEAEKLIRHDESYLFHEYLEETNHPIYFYEFVQRAAAQGLHYVTEAQYWTMGACQPDELFKSFGDSALDWHDREQIFDFIQGRAFRNAVLCRTGIPCSRTPSAQALFALRLNTLVRPATANVTTRPDGGEDFYNLRGDFALATNDPIIKAALHILNESWPRSVAFETLWSKVQERLASTPVAADGGGCFASSREGLAASLLDNFAHNIVELQVREPQFTTQISEFPLASPVARLHAPSCPRAANLRHRLIALVDFDQLVLAHLDGRHDRRALLAKMTDAFERGDVAIQFRGSPVTDPRAAQPLLEQVLEETLSRFAAGALLVG
jgi:SAM-dependent methyltransferase/methyltransferase-like protein